MPLSIDQTSALAIPACECLAIEELRETCVVAISDRSSTIAEAPTPGLPHMTEEGTAQGGMPTVSAQESRNGESRCVSITSNRTARAGDSQSVSLYETSRHRIERCRNHIGRNDLNLYGTITLLRAGIHR